MTRGLKLYYILFNGSMCWVVRRRLRPKQDPFFGRVRRAVSKWPMGQNVLTQTRIVERSTTVHQRYVSKMDNPTYMFYYLIWLINQCLFSESIQVCNKIKALKWRTGSVVDPWPTGLRIKTLTLIGVLSAQIRYVLLVFKFNSYNTKHIIR